MTETTWLSDPIGRVKNISLAPSPKNALFPLFEALMNAIHAIEERFGEDGISNGNISIEVLRGDDENTVGFVVTDNGVGFTPDNMRSFRKLDSMQKAAKGGKGVGRLLWLKVAEKTNIKSFYSSEGKTQFIEFNFQLDKANPISELIEKKQDGLIGSVVSVNPYKRNYAIQFPKKLDTIAVRTIAHFINYFVNVNSPTIKLIEGAEDVDLFEKFSDDYERDKDYNFKLEINQEEHDFIIHCFLVPKNYSDDEKGTNAIFFGANGRAVKRFEMDAVLGMKAVDGKWAFFGYVESEILNKSANDTRTDYSLSDETIEEIKRAAIVKAKVFLAEEIKLIREKQAKTISEVRNEHLRFYNVARKPEEVVQKLDLATQSKEEIFIELSRYSLREYNRKKASFQKSKIKELSDIDATAKEYVEELEGASVSALAEYVYKRKLILEVFGSTLGYENPEDEQAYYEKVVHGLICPLNSTSDDLGYEDHNLWVIDDRLAFYTYFNSDKQFKGQVTEPDTPSKRPDVTFFDLGLGFEQAGSNDPVTVIEFKRPKRDDYTLVDNPFLQVQNYVETLRNAGEATKADGVPIRAIDQTTPFMCHVVADVTDSLKTVMKHLGGFYQKAGTTSYYRWDPEFKVFIEVSSYGEVLRSAKARHEAFFTKLGINA